MYDSFMVIHELNGLIPAMESISKNCLQVQENGQIWDITANLVDMSANLCERSNPTSSAVNVY